MYLVMFHLRGQANCGNSCVRYRAAVALPNSYFQLRRYVRWQLSVIARKPNATEHQTALLTLLDPTKPIWDENHNTSNADF